MIRRVAILGGGIGSRHLDGYLALPERFSVSHVCDLIPERATALAARAGANPDAAIPDILADPAVDLVDICLPPFMHAPVALDALAAGKHVIVEKPLAGSLAAAEQLVKVEADSGRRVFPVFQYRHGRALAMLEALGAEGMLGRPLVASLETHWNRGADYYADSWRGTWEGEMGGAVLSHAIHIHDLAVRAFGPVAEVSAFLDTRVNPVETEDCAAIALRTASGALVTSSITLGAADDMSRLRLVYEHATLESARAPYAPAESDWTVTARDPTRREEMDMIAAQTVAIPRLEGFEGCLAEIADALDGVSDAAAALADGVASIELVTAIYHAARTGGRVALPLDRSLAICRDLRP